MSDKCCCILHSRVILVSALLAMSSVSVIITLGSGYSALEIVGVIIIIYYYYYTAVVREL